MSPVHVDGLPIEVRTKVLKQIGEVPPPVETSTASDITATGDFKLFSDRLTKTGLSLPAGLSQSEWTAIGENLRTIESRSIQWWIGDWLNYGEKEYGDKYTKALEVSGYEYKSLANMKSVAKAMESSLRRENLSWSHHKEVASLPEDEQKRLLDRAEKDGLTVRDLRDIVQQRSGKRPATPSQPPIPSDRDSDIVLIPCGRNDPRYVEIRDRHYIPNHGTIGRQAHFLIQFKGEVVGIISGASPVYATKPRDEFFGIVGREMRDRVLNGIVNNSVFRLEITERNLATRVLRMWRELIPHFWYERYGTIVYGFETFVVETDSRVGTLYKADGWTSAGVTAGAAKVRSGIDKPADNWKDVEPKLVLCKWRDGFSAPCSASTPAWVRNVSVGVADGSETPEQWEKDKHTRRAGREYFATGGNDPLRLDEAA